MNGKNKNMNIVVRHLGVAKNMPYFIREVSRVMPDIKIGLDSVDKNFNEILQKDLEKYDVDMKNVYFEKIKDKNSFNVEFDFWNSPFISDKNFGDINFWIDPLKFEKDKFWTDEKIDSVKKKYFDDEKKILLLGSFHEGDLMNTLDTLKMVDCEKKYNCLIVPRNSNSEYYFEEMLKTKGIDVGEGSNFLMDSTFGILEDLYSISDKVLLGNSFSNVKYVQNPLEPAFYSKKIISGMKDSKLNSEAYEGLKESGLLKVVSRDSFDFKYKLFDEIMREESEEEVLQYKSKAFNYIQSMKGASKVYANISQKMIYDNLESSKRASLEKKLGMNEILNFCK